MENRADPQLDLFDPDAELSAIGVSRSQLAKWANADLISFDPSAAKLERWMLQEAAFLHHLTKIEWSVNALRQLLLPLQRPYLKVHGRHFFNFQTMAWERRYQPLELLDTGAVEAPEEIGTLVRHLIRRLALAGERIEVFKTLAVLREVLPDDWILDELAKRRPE
ncbi:MAG: hypothetical protein ABL971_09575 [Vicinamibacterales bacterium]